MRFGRTVFAFAARQLSPSAMARQVLVGALVTAVLALFARFLCGQVLPIDPSCAPDRWKWDAGCDPVIWHVAGLTDFFAVAGLAIGLFIVVPALITAQLGQERRSGTLEQLRTSPASSAALVGGFILGAPIRIYLLLAAPLAYHVVYGLTGGLSFHALFGSLVVLGLGALALSTLAVAAALGPRRTEVSAMQPLALAALLGFTGLIAFGMSTAIEPELTGMSAIHPMGALGSTLFVDDGVFRHIFAASAGANHGQEPAAMASLAMAPLTFALFALPFTAILGGAALRRLRDPELPLFSKPLGIGLFGIVLAAVVLPMVRSGGRGEGIVYLCVYGGALLPLVLVLAQLMTPTAERWAIGLQRPQSLFSDARGPLAAVLVMLLVFTTTIATLFGMNGPSLAGVGAMWGMYLALTAPVFFLYRATHHAGGLFLFGYSLFFLAEFIGISALDSTVRGHHPVASTLCYTAALIGLGVPGWLTFRQRQLRRKLLGA